MFFKFLISAALLPICLLTTSLQAKNNRWTEPKRAEKPKWSFQFSCGTQIPQIPQRPQRPVMVIRPMPSVVVMNCRSNSYSYATLTPWKVSRKGDLVQLDDGSQWKVRHRHQKEAKRWRMGEAILLETSPFFSWSTYKLINYTRNESIEVELVEPLVSGSYSHWIAEIHPYNGYLKLQDGSIWQMSPSELLKWRVNDDIIIGINKDWFSGEHSYVLVNPRAKNRLMAIFFLGINLN